jgi:dihydrofolate reductase
MATRSVIVQELVSVDGFVAGPSGELEFFEAVSDYSAVDQDNLSILDQVDTILLGSKTYRMFVEYWPTAEDELMADVVNSTPKIVFSSTLDRAPWGRFEPARVLKGSAVDHLQRLRREPGQGLMVWGSISLAQSLLKAGLVDEMQLRVIPTMVGHGRTLLAEDTGGVARPSLASDEHSQGAHSQELALPVPHRLEPELRAGDKPHATLPLAAMPLGRPYLRWKRHKPAYR